MILQVKSGPDAGKKVTVPSGKPFVIGRSPRTNLSFPQDAAISGNHCELQFDGKRCRLVDLASRNGTVVNGRVVRSAYLQEGDEIELGGVKLIVREVEERTDRALLTVGGWSFYSAPKGWDPVENVGFRRAVKDRFPASVVVAQDDLKQDGDLRRYIDRQILVLKDMLPDPRFIPLTEAKLAGMSETLQMDIQFESRDRKAVLHRQYYGRHEDWAAVVTLTSLQSEWKLLEPVFGEVLQNLRFASSLE